MDIQANDNNELQKAIDDITKGSADVATGASELEAQIQSQMGVPPVPPVPEATTAPVMPDATVVPPVAQGAEPAMAPDMAATVPEAPVAEPSVPVPETTATEEAPAMGVTPGVDMSVMGMTNVGAPAETPVTSEVAPVDTPENVDSVKGAIARDLYGLLDVVEAEPEEKFKVVKEMIEETGDKSMIVKGYDEAKNIADEKAKAEALLYLFENA